MIVYTYRNTISYDELITVTVDEQHLDEFGKLYALREQDGAGVPLIRYYDAIWGIGWCYERVDTVTEAQAIEHMNQQGRVYYHKLYEIMRAAKSFTEQVIASNNEACALQDIIYVAHHHRLFRRWWPELADAILQSAYAAEDRIDPDNAERRRAERTQYRCLMALVENEHDARDLEEHKGVWSIHTPQYKEIARRVLAMKKPCCCQ